MSITLAKSAGFCFGVSRAVETVEKQAAEGKKVVTLGPIIHNRHVVDKFRSMGVEVIEKPEDAPAGSTVIIRSHGVSRDVCSRLEAQGVEVVDATCPFVKRITVLSVQRRRKAGFPSSSEPVLIRRWRELQAGAADALSSKMSRNWKIGSQQRILLRKPLFVWFHKQPALNFCGKCAKKKQKNSLLI